MLASLTDLRSESEAGRSRRFGHRHQEVGRERELPKGTGELALLLGDLRIHRTQRSNENRCEGGRAELVPLLKHVLGHRVPQQLLEADERRTSSVREAFHLHLRRDTPDRQKAEELRGTSGRRRRFQQQMLDSSRCRGICQQSLASTWRVGAP